MSNKKGYTLVELVVVLAFISTIIASVLYIPATLLSDNKEYEAFSDSVKSANALKTTLSSDILSENVEVLEANSLQIGEHIYKFSEGVSRDGIIVTDEIFEFSVDNNLLRVFNEDVNLEYYFEGSLGGAL